MSRQQESGGKRESGRNYFEDEYVGPATAKESLYRYSKPGLSGTKESVWPTRVGEKVMDEKAVWGCTGRKTIESGLN